MRQYANDCLSLNKFTKHFLKTNYYEKNDKNSFVDFGSASIICVGDSIISCGH
jgi:hypothetical protein